MLKLKPEQHKVLEDLVRDMGVEELMVYIGYNINNSGKLQTKFSLSTFLLLELFNRQDLLQYLKETSGPEETL